MSTVRITSGFGSFDQAVRALQESSHHDERETAVSVLGKSCSEEALPPLIQALHSDSADYIRAMCAGFLGSLRGAGCKEALMKALSDTAANVRMRAVTGLARYDQTDCYSAIESLRNDPDESVRFQVERALKAKTKASVSGCPYLSRRGFCDPPAVGQLEDCSWVIHGRGHYTKCAVYEHLGPRTRPKDPNQKQWWQFWK